MMSDVSKGAISVIGLGKLGAPLAACLAAKGYDVIGVDVNPDYVARMNAHLAPVYEPGLQELIEKNQQRIRATEDLSSAIQQSDVTFIVVATPSDDKGQFSLRYVLPACESIGRALRTKTAYHLIIVTSTVTPGATGGPILQALEKNSGKESGKDFGLCFSPEFIALGSVIRDFLNPDFLLIGESDPRAGERLQSIYENICENQPKIARMNYVNAELTKLAVNTYVTTKITFANMLARICEKLPDANVDVVTNALGMDSRIGKKYLKGAIGYGGPCFPRDNAALAGFARELGAPAILAEATDRSNRREILHLLEVIKSRCVSNTVVGIGGLSYKPDTDVVEESQGLLLAERLVADGIPVIAYDPISNKSAEKVLGSKVRFASGLAELLQEAEVIAITTPWKEFRQIPELLLSLQVHDRVIVDCWRLFSEGKLRVREYIPLGVGSV